MKTSTLKIHLLLIVLFVCSFLSCSEAQDAEKLSADEMSSAEIKTAKTFITEFHNKLSEGSTYNFNEENATETMIRTFSPEMQKNAYEQIKAQVGEYKNADYTEAWVTPSTPEYKILRFKGDFTGKSEKWEVRVVLDKSNKIAGFFVIPWSDMLVL